jgi:hypothetical protein
MSEGPSIKGVGLLNTWAEVNELIDLQMVSREELCLRLGSEALEILENKVEPSLWYPIEAIEQLVAIVVEFKAGGDMGYLLEMGERGFSRLIERQSFKTFVDSAAQHGQRAGQSLIGLTQLLFNFGEWKFVGDDLENFHIEIREASALGELLCWVAQGYATAILSYVTGAPCELALDCADPSCIVLRSGDALSSNLAGGAQRVAG